MKTNKPSPESPIEEVPKDKTPSDRRQPDLSPYVEQFPNYGGNDGPQFGYMGHSYPYNLDHRTYPSHATYTGYQTQPVYQPDPSKNESSNLGPLKLFKEKNKNVCSSDFKDCEYGNNGVINLSPPLDAQNLKVDIYKKEDDSENNLKQEYKVKKEDEFEPYEAYCTSYNKSNKDNEEMYRDDEDAMCEDNTDKSWPNIPVEAIIKYEDSSDDNDEDYSPNNSTNMDTNSRMKCPFNCEMTFQGRQWVIQHLRGIHKMDLSEAKKMVPKIKSEKKWSRHSLPTNAVSDTPGDICSDNRMKCPLNCGSTFKDKQWILQHLHRIHKLDKSEAKKILPPVVTPENNSDGKISCPQCHKLFINKVRLDIHVEHYHDVGDYNCDKCGDTFQLKGKLKVHVYTKHSQPLSLSMTDKQSNSRLKGPLSCESTSRESNVRSEERSYPCEYCDKRFKDALTHKRHTNVQHTQEETHVCDHCGNVFYAKYELNKHLAKKHGINNLYQCDKCNVYLMSVGSLLKHKMKCSTFPCPVCGKEFKTKWKLKDHVNGHLNNKSHMCDECGMDFLHARTLVDHIDIVHQGKRPFQCDSCSKTFTRRGSLRIHKLIHAGIKSFPCPLCEQLFREKRRLKTHLQRKHKIDDNEMSNYVKVMPKKEIVEKEDEQRLLQAIYELKSENMTNEVKKEASIKFDPSINMSLENEEIKEEDLSVDDVYGEKKSLIQ